MVGTGIVGRAISPVSDGQEMMAGKAAIGKGTRATATVLDVTKSRKSWTLQCACVKLFARRASSSRQSHREPT